VQLVQPERLPLRLEPQQVLVLQLLSAHQPLGLLRPALQQRLQA